MSLSLKTRKIVAREFIIFIITLVITLLGFLYTVFYNISIDNKIKALNVDFANNVRMGDSLSKIYKAKTNNQQWLYFQLLKEVDLGSASYNNYESLWRRFEEISKHDSLIYKYDYVWSNSVTEPFKHIGFNTAEKLNDFIERNAISSKDSIDYKHSNNIFDKNKLISTQIHHQGTLKFTSRKQLTFSSYCFLAAFTILFIFRWIFYGIKWSIKTLKEK
jgi:hypothetical protein